jgi:D-glycero-D-manno-heptose 1,7-bisphosphate phosphatase
MRRAVFLDRDGVINRAVVRDGKPYPPADLAALEILPGVPEALTALHKAGFLLIVVTNQPDVARGTIALSDVEDINHYLQQYLPIDEFRVCYHDNQSGCDCRKPLPGLLTAAALAHDIDFTNSFMVGDRWSDIEAGNQAGCKTFFIDCGYAEKQPTSMNFVISSLFDASEIILRMSHEKN